MSDKLFDAALQNLKYYWGYDAFRPGQDEVVRSVLDGKETVVLFPTGGGKSLCYQIPATVLPGLTLVISPLVALMQDQVDQLLEKGIPATFINSTIPLHQVEQRFINAANGMYKILYCAPERLQTPFFQAEAKNLNLSLVAVDEAHCISEWGHDFRPPYRAIRQNIDESVGEVTWMALTATATPEVKNDIIKVLGFENPNVISKGFERKNLKWWVEVTEQKAERLIKMVEKAPGSGLIYAGTRRSCDELAELIRKQGKACKSYHAGLEPEDRKKIQQDWITNKLPLVVATNAFGMGIDKPDCRYVIHYDIPYSLEAYYQEAGRAGRDGKMSYPTLLVRGSDLNLAQRRIEDSYPDYEILGTVYQTLGDSLHLATSSPHEISERVDISALSRRSGLNTRLIRSSLRVLNRLGVIELTDVNFSTIGIRLLMGQESLYTLMNSYANEAKKEFLDGLIRIFLPEALSEEHFQETEYVLAKMNLSFNALIKGMSVFQKEGVLEFQVLEDAPEVRFIEPRYARIPVTKSESEHFRNIQLEKLRNMIAYAQTGGCRSAFIRNYFGEEKVPEKCGNCDRCIREKKSAESGFTQTQVNEVVKVLRKSPSNLDDIAEASNLPPEIIKPVLKWLANEKKVKYDRKTDRFLWLE